MLNPTQARFFALPSLIALPFSITDSLDPFICSGSSQAATPFTFTGLEQSMLNVKHQGGRYQKEQTLVQAFSTKSRRFSKSLRHSLNDSRRQSLGKLARNSLGSRRGSGQLPSPLKSLGSRRGSGQLPSPLKSQRRLTGEGAPFWEQRSGRCDSPGGSLLQKSRKDSTGSLLPRSRKDSSGSLADMSHSRKMSASRPRGALNIPPEILVEDSECQSAGVVNSRRSRSRRPSSSELSPGSARLINRLRLLQV